MIKIFVLKRCPYCINALKDLDALLQDETYRDIDIKIIDENQERALADSYDYYYVPTFYLDDVKLHEGLASRDDIKAVLDKALNG